MEKLSSKNKIWEHASNTELNYLSMICSVIYNDFSLGQSRRNSFRMILYAVTLCAVSVTLWTIFFTRNEVITISFTSNNQMLKAVYKCAYENNDDTVDLVFNIPKSGHTLLKHTNLHLNISKNKKEPPATEAIKAVNPEPTRRVRTLYPISLDTDYAINTPNLCPREKEVDYLIIVHSATAYFARRRVIRETFGARNLFGHIVQRVVFLVGLTNDPVATKSIQEEAFLNRDIVQGQFMESYYNLTHKGVLGLRWISEHCPQAKTVIKMDDDVFINPFKLVREILPLYANKTRHIACHLKRGGSSQIVRGKGKWQVHDDEFKGHQFYPFDYCNGYFVILTNDLIRPMFKAARMNPFFWIDDVYLFGILPATVGSVKFVDIRNILTLRFKNGEKCFEENGTRCKYVAVSQWMPNEPEKLWYKVLSNMTRTEKRELRVFGLS